jgi:hypothetical protein
VMVASMKEHKETVNSLVVRGNDLECVSACNDGSCIIWDLQRFVRRGNLLANTFFKCARRRCCPWHPSQPCFGRGTGRGPGRCQLAGRQLAGALPGVELARLAYC